MRTYKKSLEAVRGQLTADEIRRAKNNRSHERHLVRKAYFKAQQELAVLNKRTPEAQLAVLDERLGVGVGAKKERKRLQQQIEDKRNAIHQGISTTSTESKGRTRKSR